MAWRKDPSAASSATTGGGTPHTCYVEAFAGGAAVLFARQPAKVEVLNDTHGELVRLYRVVTHHLDEFVRQFRWALTSREMFRFARMQRSALQHGAILI